MCSLLRAAWLLRAGVNSCSLVIAVALSCALELSAHILLSALPSSGFFPKTVFLETHAAKAHCSSGFSCCRGGRCRKCLVHKSRNETEGITSYKEYVNLRLLVVNCLTCCCDGELEGSIIQEIAGMF